jgi:hypothetical protein
LRSISLMIVRQGVPRITEIRAGWLSTWLSNAKKPQISLELHLVISR